MRFPWTLLATASALVGCTVPVGLAAQIESDEILEAHNEWRALHRVAPLSWSDELAQYAQAWAETLVTRHPGLLLHSEDGNGVRPEAHRLGYGGWGENLYWGSAIRMSDGRREAKRDLPARHVVDSWGNEAESYDFATGLCSPQAPEGCGHFTQIVWKETTRVGCGRAFGADGAQVWACSYDPPGNYAGEFELNVLPAGRR